MIASIFVRPIFPDSLPRHEHLPLSRRRKNLYSTSTQGSPLLTHEFQYPGRQGLSMVWYQSEVAGTIIVQTLPVIRHIARDPTVQRSLVSVPLNQIDTVNQGKIWDGSDTEARGQYSVTVGTGDMETGLTCPGQVHSPVPPLPSRNSWSTYSQNEKKPTAT